MDKYNFQFCQKLVIFSRDGKLVLLCKRVGEADYDGVFGFPGGKMETTDKDFLVGIEREKDEELGKGFKIKVSIEFTYNNLYQKKKGKIMVNAHYYAIHARGNIKLNRKEYSEYKWVLISDLNKFEPKIPTIPEVVEKMKKIKEIMCNDITI